MKICILGDSVTYGGYVEKHWAHLLRLDLELHSADEVEVYNLGVNGDTSDDILQRAKSELSARMPNIILFAFGVNDSGYILSTNEPLVPETRFIRNLADIITIARSLTNDIAFIGPVLGDDTLLKPYPESSRGKSYDRTRTMKYDAVLEEVVSNAGCQYIHLFSHVAYEDFMDGLHPNEIGHRKIFETVRSAFLFTNTVS